MRPHSFLFTKKTAEESKIVCWDMNNKNVSMKWTFDHL